MPVLANSRHELFAQELAKGETSSSAYVIAGFKANDGNASRLKGNEKIQARVAEILAAGAARAEITREKVLNELGRIGFSDLRKMFTPGGNLLPVADMDDETVAAIASFEIVRRKVRGSDDDEFEDVAKVRCWDKRGALVDIAKMQGWHVERHEHTGKDGGAIEYADKTDREKAKDIAFLLARGERQPTVN